MTASTSSSNQLNGHLEIFNIISNRQNEGLQDDDYERIETILNDCDVNARLHNCNNETLMHAAIREQNEKLIRLIYKKNGDFFVKNELNQTPRDLAVELECINIIKFIDENEKINFMDEEFFVENITNENKGNIKAIKLSDESKLNELILSHVNADNCQTFPNLFAFKILKKYENEKKLIDKISAQFNDGRPLLVYFQSMPSSFHFKRDNLKDFEVANAEISEKIQLIFNQRYAPISLIEKYCKSNDSLMIRILKLRKSSDDLKMVESVLKLSDNLDLFKAVIYEPFTQQSYDFIGIEQMIFCDYNKSLLELTIQYDRNDAVEYLIGNLKFHLQYLPFNVKKKLVDYVAHKKMIKYRNTLHELVEFDFPFPENVDEINVKRIQKIMKDREIFKSNDLQEIKKYVNENKSMRIGYDRENKSALLYAIETKKFNVYSYLLSVGFRNDNPHEIKEKIDELSDVERYNMANEIANIAKSDDKNYLRLLTNKFGIFNHYDNKKAYFGEIFKILEELNSIKRCKPLLRICADVEMLKVTLDLESENINKIYPSDHGLGVACSNRLIFKTGQQNNEIKKTIIHELCHLAMNAFYENRFNPYYLNDCKSSEKFQRITTKILDLVESESQIDIETKRIISNTLNDTKDNHQSEMIARAFEILVNFNGNESEMKKLPNAFAKLFDFVDEHVVKALLGDDFKNRTKIRDLNASIGLLKSIKEANKILQLCNKTENDVKLLKIFDSSQNKHFIVSNVPKLALINIVNHLSSTQKSLFDAKNIFLDSKHLNIQKKLEEFENIQENVSSLIIDISNGCEYKEFLNETKLIFVASKDKFNESQTYLELNYEWKDLSEESQKKLVEKVHFQGKEFKLSEIINEDLINESILDNEVFVDFCNESRFIKINSEVNQFDVFVERQFNKIKESKNIDDSDDIEETFANSHVDLVTKVKNSAKILISDIAGSGKSYALKKISHLLMSKCNSQNIYWVLFIDLRKFLNEFYEWKGEKCFLSFFKVHFGKNLNSFERKIFENLYNSGKVKILLDGFDEISPKCKDIVIEFIKSIDLNVKRSDFSSSLTSETKTFNNQLWMTTRKHFEFELQNRLEISEIFSLKSLETDEEMTKFLIAYWKSKDIQLNTASNLDELAKEVILKFREIKLDNRNLIGEMQQLKILAEICIQNDKIKVESLNNFTKYDIYERSIEQFNEKWKKRHDCKELVKKVDMSYSPNFVINHQYRALLELIDKDIVAKFFSHFGKMWSLEEIEKGGLVTFENDKAYFIHTTYLEFFIANFMMQSLEKSVLYSGMLIELFCQIMFIPYLTTTQMFVEDKINSLNLSEDIIEMFQIHFNTKLTDFNILELSIKQNHESVFDFLIKIIEKINDNKRKLILVSGTEYPLYLSLQHSKNNIFNKLLKITAEYLTADEFYELIQKKIYEYTIFHLFNNDNVTSKMNSLISTMENKIEHKIKNSLLSKGGSNNCLSIQMLLLSTNSDSLDKFEYFFNFHLKYMSLEELIENSVDDNGSNILHYIANNRNMFVHENLWKRIKVEFQSNKRKLNQLLDKRSTRNYNFLHALVRTKKSSVEILKFNLIEIEKICDMKYFLLCKGGIYNRLSIQILLSKKDSENFDKFEYFLNFHLKYMSLEELIENSVNDNGSNILHYIANILNIFVHKKLWEQYKNEFQSTQSKLYQILDKRDARNYNFLHILVAIQNPSLEILKYNLNEISKFFSNSFEIVSTKCHGNTLLQIALIREQSFEFFNTLWQLVKDSCSRDYFVTHINELNLNKKNVFYVALEISEKENNNKTQFIEFIIDSLKNDLEMSQSEMKSFLRPQISSKEKNNILICMAKNVSSIEIHEYLWRNLENVFDANEILDLINEVDLDGFNLLSNVIASNIQRNLSVVEFTWNLIKNYLITTLEQRNHVEKCHILLDRFPDDKWIKELLNSYEIDLSTYNYAKRKKNINCDVKLII